MQIAFAQEETGEKKKTKVHIEHYDQISYNRNLGEFQRLIGNVKIRHDSAYFFCDSAYFYEKTNSFDAYQNVHIIVNDSVEIFSDLLNYDGNARFAEFFDNVKLRDDSTLLQTQYLTYDRNQHLACYPDSACTTRGNKTLISCLGYYRDDLKELSFFENVEVTSPKYQMYTDTLFYNTEKEKMWFWGPTDIINEENKLYGEHGYYLVDEDIAYFDKKPVMRNETQRLKSDSIFYNRAIGLAKAFDHVDMIDTSYKVVLRGDYVEMWEKKGFSYATDSAYAAYFDDSDTLFIHADTMFFHFKTKWNNEEKMIGRRNVRFFKSDMQGKCDTMTYLVADSTIRMRVNPILWAEDSQLTGDFIDIKIADHKIDSVVQRNNAFIINQDTVEGFNQIKGTDIISRFRNGNIHNVNVNGGNAETIYWLREDDAALIGIDISKADNMVIEMKGNNISLIKSYKGISETMYPEKDLPENERLLQGFKWNDEIRPKDKADIFRKVDAVMPRNDKPEQNETLTETSEETPAPRHRVKNPR
ncbi:MAG: hypothetical protein MJZ91_10080 [Bacteroidales bacterium]|nr:hypothetical protein [Bacteroidales bacterium]